MNEMNEDCYPFYKNKEFSTKEQEKLFKEFVKSRILSEDCYESIQGYTYLDTFYFTGSFEHCYNISINKDGSFTLLLDRSEWASRDLNELERALFWWVYENDIDCFSGFKEGRIKNYVESTLADLWVLLAKDAYSDSLDLEEIKKDDTLNSLYSIYKRTKEVNAFLESN